MLRRWDYGRDFYVVIEKKPNEKPSGRPKDIIELEVLGALTDDLKTGRSPGSR